MWRPLGILPQLQPAATPPELSTIDQMAISDLPTYIKTIRGKSGMLAALLAHCSAGCIQLTEAQYADIRLVFDQAVKNIHARAIVAEYDLAALALAIQNPNGKAITNNRITYAGMEVPCCDKWLAVLSPTNFAHEAPLIDRFANAAEFATATQIAKQIPGGISVFVASTMLKSKFIIGWNNPKTNKLRDAIAWAVLGPSQDKTAFLIQTAMLQLLYIAPIPDAWVITIRTQLESLEKHLASRNLTFAQRNDILIALPKISRKMDMDSGARLVGNPIKLPEIPGETLPGTQPATDPKKPGTEPFDWSSPVVVLGFAGVAAIGLLIFVQRAKRQQ